LLRNCSLVVALDSLDCPDCEFLKNLRLKICVILILSVTINGTEETFVFTANCVEKLRNSGVHRMEVYNTDRDIRDPHSGKLNYVDSWILSDDN
jgi:hypothetical protein